MIVAEAPGKLMMCGEYAVLAGAPGIAVAVGVRARVNVTPMSGSGNRLVMGDADRGFGFHWSPGRGISWDGESPGEPGRPLSAVAQVMAVHGLLDAAAAPPACHVEITTGDFFHTAADGTRQKLGLGSSAAVIVALTGALFRLFRISSDEQLLSLAVEAHRLMQAGTGSGVDVATAAIGGAVGVTFAGPGEPPRPRPLSWPRNLLVVPVWSGSGAATEVMLSRLGVFRDANRTAFNAHMARLGALATRALASWESRDVSGILSAIEAYADALRQFDTETRLQIWTPAHERLSRMADRRGAIYKPSGAGGGDFGIALADSAKVAGEVRNAYVEAGYSCIDVGGGERGLTVWSEP
jgi:phosphomevalonate kinase